MWACFRAPLRMGGAWEDSEIAENGGKSEELRKEKRYALKIKKTHEPCNAVQIRFYTALEKLVCL